MTDDPSVPSTADPASSDVTPRDYDGRPPRTWLVVMDESAEMRAALRYACQRARHTGGRVALLHVTEAPEFQHFGAIAELMEQESRETAEQEMQRMAAEAAQMAGSLPVLYLREGEDRADAVMTLITEEEGLSVLVLASGTGGEGPGPIISSLIGRQASQLPIPVTVVPGGLDDDAIDLLA